MFKDNVLLFSMHTQSRRHDVRDDMMLMSFNHYIDDHRYLRISARGRKENTYIALFRDPHTTRILHSPMLSFDDSVAIACTMTQDFVPPSEYQKDEYMDIMLVAAGLRNYFGITTVSTAKVLKKPTVTDIKECNLSKYVVDRKYTDIIHNMEGQSVIGSTIMSIQDFRSTIIQNMKLMQANCLFVRDLSSVMVEVDMRTHTNKSDYTRFNESKAHDIRNIELKRINRRWIDELIKHCGVIIDSSVNFSLGDRVVCNGVVCTDEAHKHSTIIYIKL